MTTCIDKPWQFQKGNPGNPNGRPKGSRDKIAHKTIEIFSTLLYETDEEEEINRKTENAAALSARTLMRNKPEAFWKIMMKFLPQQIQTVTSITSVDSIPPDELDAALDTIRNKIKELQST